MQGYKSIEMMSTHEKPIPQASKVENRVRIAKPKAASSRGNTM
jgi:hypothetical protein